MITRPGQSTLLMPLVLSILLWPGCALANLVHEDHRERWVILTDGQPQVETHNALYVHKDPLSQLSLSYLKNHNIQFKPYPKKVFNEGFTEASYWLKLHVRNDSQKQNKWLLEVGYPLLDRLEVYIEDRHDKRLRTYDLGDLKNFDQRPIEHRHFVIPLDFSQHSVQTLYLNIQTSSSLQAPLRFWQSEHFIEQHTNEQYSLGIYYGMMLVMFLYNLFLWLSFRDNNYLLYIGYIGSFAALQLATSGLGFQFIWGYSPYIAQLAVPLTIALVGVFGTAFTRNFLHTKNNYKFSDNALLICMALSAITGLLSFVLSTAAVMSLAAPVVLGFLIVILYASVETLVHGQREARFFLAAWVAFIVGGLITILTIFGALPSNVWTIHASKIGSAFEIVLLSFALADRINILQLEKKEAEQKVKEELHKKAESLLESNRLKNDFLATISHEFRTPLNGILGSLELAADVNDNELVSSLKDAKVSANEMLELVDNVLTYTELQSGTRVANPENVELGPALEYFSETVRPLCAAKNLNFELAIDANLPERLYVDIKCVRHALKALIDNAIKFTQSGNIRLSLSQGNLRDQECLEIRVQDSGIGMSATELNKVQGFMAQGDSSHQRRYQGLGIGLSLVRAVCHCLYGDIKITSEKGQGTTVTLKLPAASAVKAKAIDIKQEPLQQQVVDDSELRGRVLIVEDNTINQKVLRSMLNRLHLKSDIADNGEKALELLAQPRDYQYDLIFMDCQMPVMDGFEATKHIRASGKREATIPIIAATANAMSGDEQHCLDVGMNDYLSKPINMEQVRLMIYKWLPRSTDNVKAADISQSGA